MKVTTDYCDNDNYNYGKEGYDEGEHDIHDFDDTDHDKNIVDGFKYCSNQYEQQSKTFQTWSRPRNPESYPWPRCK